jgi:hypothetical protein
LGQLFLTTGNPNLLDEAVARDPYYSWAWIQLGLAAERAGNLKLAEQDLLRATETDHRFGPRWTLCDFYFRHGPAERFWRWAGMALRVPETDGRPVFRLAWRNEPNPRGILDRGIVSTKAARRQFLTFLIAEAPLDSAASVVSELPLDQTDLLIAYIGKLLDKGHASQAVAVWNALARKGTKPFREIHPESGELLTNADFATAPSGIGFDWQFHPAEGLSLEGNTVRFSGREPENCRILSQRVPVVTGREYAFGFAARVDETKPFGGLRWRVFEGNTVLAESSGLADTLSFRSAASSLVTVALDYDRPRGETRLAGAVALSGLSIHAAGAR